jgi:hypothetical protein
MHLVGKVWGNIPTKLQIDFTGNHGVMPLGHNPSTRLMPLGHRVSVYGNKKVPNKNTKSKISIKILRKSYTSKLEKRFEILRENR